MERHQTGSNLYLRTNFEFLNLDASQWALAELAQADALGLIPDVLRGADLTAPITRAEFAAVAVKTYEALSGEAASLPAVSPFSDCSHPEVLKAYQLGITTGTGDGTTFSPRVLLNREQAAAHADPGIPRLLRQRSAGLFHAGALLRRRADLELGL